MHKDTREKIEHNFIHHAPDNEKIRRHTKVREDCLDLALTFGEELPDSREKALALTKLEEAMFWANAAIARNNTD